MSRCTHTPHPCSSARPLPVMTTTTSAMETFSMHFAIDHTSARLLVLTRLTGDGEAIEGSDMVS